MKNKNTIDIDQLLAYKNRLSLKILALIEARIDAKSLDDETLEELKKLSLLLKELNTDSKELINLLNISATGKGSS